MKSIIHVIFFCSLAISFNVTADEIYSIAHPGPSTIETPAHGLSMDEVVAKFGEPISKQNAIGTPPIIKWVYADFTVYFEAHTVIHSVNNKK